MSLIEDALSNSNCVVSVIGDHAGEGADSIFHRKLENIEVAGKTFWLIRSSKARPNMVQELNRGKHSYAIFVEPSTVGGARPTVSAETAKEFSENGLDWKPLPEKLGPVTGKLGKGATALVFDRMSTNVSGVIDLWEFGEAADATRPLKFIRGCSTVCAVRSRTGTHRERMRSRFREIVAVAKFAYPYGVWLR